MPLKRKLSVPYLCERWNAGQTITANVMLLFDLGRVSSSSDKQDRAAGLTHLTASLSPPNFENWGTVKKLVPPTSRPSLRLWYRYWLIYLHGRITNSRCCCGRLGQGRENDLLARRHTSCVWAYESWAWRLSRSDHVRRAGLVVFTAGGSSHSRATRTRPSRTPSRRHRVTLICLLSPRLTVDTVSYSSLWLALILLLIVILGAGFTNVGPASIQMWGWGPGPYFLSLIAV